MESQKLAFLVFSFLHVCILVGLLKADVFGMISTFNISQLEWLVYCWFHNQGLPLWPLLTGIEHSTTSDPNAAQDVNRALSLLSTNSWGAYATKSLSLEQHSNRATGSTTQSMTTHAITQRLPLPSSEFWHTDHHQPANSNNICISYSDFDNSHHRFQDFQLLSAPFESGFPCHQLD